MKENINSAYKEAVKSQSISDALRAFSPVTVPTIVHVIKDEDESVINEAEGNEQEQIDVLNKAFFDNDMGFTFELKAIRTHVSSKFWDEPCPRCNGYDNDSPMAESTREGGDDTLNVWFNNGPPYGFAMLGASFGYPDHLDGVVVKHTTVYGGSNPKKNLGTLLVHEVGHWLGLDHTFSGYSCSGDGDGVSDTAPQKSPTNTCSQGQEMEVLYTKGYWKNTKCIRVNFGDSGGRLKLSRRDPCWGLSIKEFLLKPVEVRTK